MTDGCDVTGCPKPPRSPKSRWCEKHYFRMRRHGSLDGPLPGVSYKTCHARVARERGAAAAFPCSWDGCERQSTHWSYDWFSYPEHPRRDQTTGLIYTTDLQAYVPLCGSHHWHMDRRIRAALAQVELLLWNEPLSEREEDVADMLTHDM